VATAAVSIKRTRGEPFPAQVQVRGLLRAP
jgi:hypothetical protein